MFEVLYYVIDSLQDVNFLEKQKLKCKIKKIKSLVEFEKLFNDINVSSSEKEIALIKEACVKIIQESPNYGPKTKEVLESKIKRKDHLKNITINVYSYLINNDLSI